MTSTLNVHVFTDSTESSGVAHVTISELTPAHVVTLAYSDSCYAPCTKTDLPNNRDFIVLVTYPNQPYQSQIITTGTDTSETLYFYFEVSTKGTLTVYGRFDGYEVPIDFTIVGMGGSYTTNIQLELDEGTYTLRGHYLQQEKEISATVLAGQNTDAIIQMDFDAYGSVTVECSANGQPVPAHVDITDPTGATIYSQDLPAINGAAVFELLPDTYHIHATYAGQAADEDVTIAASEGKLVHLSFIALYTLHIGGTFGGKTSPSGNVTALEGHTITVTATANANYDFIGWTLDGDDGGSENPTTVMMHSDRTLIAIFKARSTDTDLGIILVAAGAITFAGLGGYYLYRRRKKRS